MKLTPIYFALLLPALIFTACSSSAPGVNANAANRTAANANTAKANDLKDDVDELEMTVKLPFHPEEAVWREEPLGKADGRVPGPTDRKLTAVLRFLKDDSVKVVAQAEKYKTGTPEIVNTESWFPAELIAKSQMSGDGTLKGLSYPANDFFNPPYTAGRITRIEGTDFFVLELNTQ
ncbi:MAG: hypothetical protein JSS81_01585 [Acidobacteria bacterium]|nr:hypothetical protein [Acidobacteriota bacterium]